MFRLGVRVAHANRTTAIERGTIINKERQTIERRHRSLIKISYRYLSRFAIVNIERDIDR